MTPLPAGRLRPNCSTLQTGTIMADHITAYPLTWPEGWKRTTNPERSRFGTWNNPPSASKGTSLVLEQLRMMGIDRNSVIISTNVPLRLDGLPYSNRRAPEDQGVSVWWESRKGGRCIAVDAYTSIGENLWAIGKTLEAMRGIERWGGGEIMERTFTGFAALPGPGVQKAWRDVLGLPAGGIDIEDVDRQYRKLSMQHHPDRGGDATVFDELTKARQQAREELRASGRA